MVPFIHKWNKIRIFIFFNIESISVLRLLQWRSRALLTNVTCKFVHNRFSHCCWMQLKIILGSSCFSVFHWHWCCKHVLCKAWSLLILLKFVKLLLIIDVMLLSISFISPGIIINKNIELSSSRLDVNTILYNLILRLIDKLSLRNVSWKHNWHWWRILDYIVMIWRYKATAHCLICEYITLEIILVLKGLSHSYRSTHISALVTKSRQVRLNSCLMACQRNSPWYILCDLLAR